MKCVQFETVLSIKERKTSINEEKKNVLLIFVKVIYKGPPDYKIQREDSSTKIITKRKALIEQACRATSLPHPEESKGHPA